MIIIYLSGCWSIDLHSTGGSGACILPPKHAPFANEGRSSIHQPSPQATPTRVGAQTQIRTGPHAMISVDRGASKQGLFG